MKTIIFFCAWLVLAWCASCQQGYAGEDGMKAHQGSAELERLKKLAGVWEGTSMMGKEEQRVKVEYEVTAAGSAVVERLSPGTPGEMISVYHDQGGKLAMTHYCALGNQPRMILSDSDGKTLRMQFSDTPDIDPAKDQHMHGMALTFSGEDRIRSEWNCYKDGQPSEKVALDLRRVR